MKTLLIYMSENMQSHEMSVHLTKIAQTSAQEEFALAMESYRRHFNKKAAGKMHITIFDTDDTTGVITQEFNEMLIHPIKQKIVINKRVSRTTPVPPSDPWFPVFAPASMSAA